MERREKTSGSFGKRLEKELKKQGYSRAQFSRETGIGEDALANYVYDRSSPSMANLITICEKLDVSADWFIWGENQVG